ncbi:MAG TPA: hypothetical protein VFN21_04995 [Acidimicrobiales bacterium]|nr:hypothetical protein [Acidimicrobiales bacterium]
MHLAFTGHRRLRRRGMWAVTACLSVALVACNPHFGESNGPFRRGTITTQNGETFGYSGGADTVVVSSSGSNTSGNTREFFWQEDRAFYSDQQSCNTWETPTGSQIGDSIQPGLAMRIAPSGPERSGVKGITVNENIWSGAIWIFWVNVWDSSNVEAPIQGVQSFDLSPVVGKFWVDEDGLHSTLEPGPWHVCARTQGSRVSFKVWTGDDPEPSWDDPEQVHSATLPDGWDYPGYSGGYVGHIRAGQSAVFSGQSSVPLCLEPDMSDSAYCREKFAGPGSTTTTTSRSPSGATTIPGSTGSTGSVPATGG